jgi:hypothetical protein
MLLNFLFVLLCTITLSTYGCTTVIKTILVVHSNVRSLICIALQLERGKLYCSRVDERVNELSLGVKEYMKNLVPAEDVEQVAASSDVMSHSTLIQMPAVDHVRILLREGRMKMLSNNRLCRMSFFLYRVILSLQAPSRLGSQLWGYHPVAPRPLRYRPFVHRLLFRPSSPETLHVKRHETLVKDGIG